jgi:hypothetical protein
MATVQASPRTLRFLRPLIMRARALELRSTRRAIFVLFIGVSSSFPLRHLDPGRAARRVARRRKASYCETAAGARALRVDQSNSRPRSSDRGDVTVPLPNVCRTVTRWTRPNGKVCVTGARSFLIPLPITPVTGAGTLGALGKPTPPLGKSRVGAQT